MTETAVETTTETEAAPKAPKVFKSEPKLIHESLARYINENSNGEVTVTAAQAHALLTLHNKWQSSPERKQERVAEEEQRKADAEAAKEEREKATAERKAKKEAEAAAKAAKKAAAKDDDSDLDDLDELGDKPEAAAKPAAKKTRRAPAATDGLDDDDL